MEGGWVRWAGWMDGWMDGRDEWMVSQRWCLFLFSCFAITLKLTVTIPSTLLFHHPFTTHHHQTPTPRHHCCSTVPSFRLAWLARWWWWKTLSKGWWCWHWRRCRKEGSLGGRW
jgi:hypothetical protein